MFCKAKKNVKKADLDEAYCSTLIVLDIYFIAFVNKLFVNYIFKVIPLFLWLINKNNFRNMLINMYLFN